MGHVARPASLCGVKSWGHNSVSGGYESRQRRLQVLTCVLAHWCIIRRVRVAAADRDSGLLPERPAGAA